MRIILKVSTVAVVLIASRADARTWSIYPDGSGDAPTIQAGIDSATTGDSLLISPGVYDENLNTHGKGLALLGTGAPELTVVDGGARARVLLLDSGGVVECLTLRNGYASSPNDLGGGIFLNGSGPITVRNNIIENNTSEPSGGGGIASGGFVTQDIVIESNVVRGNTTPTAGGGILIGNNAAGASKLYCRSNRVYDNFAGEQGGGIACNNAIVADNVVVNNTASITGGGISAGGNDGGEISHNTVAFNHTENMTLNGAGISASVNVAITNNLIVGNHGSEITPSGAGIHCFSTIPRCNLLWQNDFNTDWCATDPSNLSQVPDFCATDPLTSMNFFIQSDSPCAPHGPCGLIGALPVGCGTTDVQMQTTTWSAFKHSYR